MHTVLCWECTAFDLEGLGTLRVGLVLVVEGIFCEGFIERSCIALRWTWKGSALCRWEAVL